MLAVGRWLAPFDLTRRYMVTGQWDGGAGRTYVHNAVITAMVSATRDRADPGASTAADRPAPPPRRSFGLLRRGQPAPPGLSADPAAPTDAELVEARRAVESLRERYLRGSRS